MSPGTAEARTAEAQNCRSKQRSNAANIMLRCGGESTRRPAFLPRRGAGAGKQCSETELAAAGNAALPAAGAWAGNAALPAAGAWAGNAALPAAGAWAGNAALPAAGAWAGNAALPA